jgi:inorganic pyrophosphatase
MPAFTDEPNILNAVIETPKNSRNKYKYEPTQGLFFLHKVLPAGAVFPFDFGYIPNTRGQDGDPLDVLILMDEPAFTGCLARVRLLGVIEAEQTDPGGKPERNDRLIAVAETSQDHANLQSLKGVSQELLDEIKHFFTSYDVMEGKQFRPLAQRGPKRALRLVKDGVKLKRQGKAQGR